MADYDEEDFYGSEDDEYEEGDESDEGEVMGSEEYETEEEEEQAEPEEAEEEEESQSDLAAGALRAVEGFAAYARCAWRRYGPESARRHGTSAQHCQVARNASWPVRPSNGSHFVFRV